MDELIGSLDVEKTLQKNDIVQHIHQLVTPFKICFEWCFLYARKRIDVKTSTLNKVLYNKNDFRVIALFNCYTKAKTSF